MKNRIQKTGEPVQNAEQFSLLNFGKWSSLFRWLGRGSGRLPEPGPHAVAALLALGAWAALPATAQAHGRISHSDPIQTDPIQTDSTQANPTQTRFDENTISLNVSDILSNIFRYVQVSTISDQEEVELGQQINQMLLTQQYQLYPNDRTNNYVDRIGQRLVDAVLDRRDIPYRFQVVVSDEINAFAIPGGYIYVTTGLLRAVDNEAQLAGVLAHEIAHIHERHGIEAIQQAVLAEGIAETAGIEMSTLAQIGYQVAVNLPRSREFEYESDRVGVEIMRRAGYSPMAFVNFLEMLNDYPLPPEFLRTHPTNQSRIEAIAEQVTANDAASTQGTNINDYEQSIFPLN